MTRFMKLAFITLFALVAATALVRAEDEKFLDSDGKEIEFFDSGVGDQDYEHDEEDKRAFDIRGKLDHRLSSRHKNVEHWTHEPEHGESLWAPSVKITWYASNDLKDPQCGAGDWDPENWSHIGAVSSNWYSGPRCGQFIRLCNKKVSRCVRVRVIDKCVGCKNDHVDLTKSAFKKLATTGTLEEGLTNHLQMYDARFPNPWDRALFGPFQLRHNYSKYAKKN